MSDTNKSQHTPEPWKLNVGVTGWFEITADRYGCKEAVICARNSWDQNAAESIANARLLFAAPKLLAALKLCANVLGALGGPSVAERKAAEDKARAAIAKAEGVTA